MTTVKVKTQQELDAALADDKVDVIDIVSSAGVWLYLTAYGSASVRAYDSASVHASGSASVTAYDSASVTAYDSASVTAYDSASVTAYGSASVTAYDSASVHASGSASVTAYDSASVRATPHVAVHLHSAHATITGGVVIDITALDLNDPHTWAVHHGVELTDDGGTALLYKATNKDLTAGHEYDKPTVYTVGATVTADDWRDNHLCGRGLHISPRPFQASRYRNSAEAGIRYLRVAVPLAELRPIGADKAKAPSVRVLAEVDIDGNDLVAAVVEQEAGR